MIESGHKVLTQTDFATTGQSATVYTRSYNQNAEYIRSHGTKWSSSFDTQLVFVQDTGTECTLTPGAGNPCTPNQAGLATIKILRPNGSLITLRRDSGNQNRWNYKDNAAINHIVRQSDGTYHHTIAGRLHEVFGVHGELRQSKNITGATWRHAYDGSFRLTSVTEPSGRVFSLGWSGTKVSYVDFPNGMRASYFYDALSRLYLVQYSGLSNDSVQFHYEDGRFPAALTGVSVGGKRYSEVSYYADRRVQSSGLVNGVHRSSFQYGPDHTTVTNAKGASSKYIYGDINGSRKLLRVERSGVVNCPNAVAERSYDSNGHLRSTTDWEGFFTSTLLDASGRLQRRTVGGGKRYNEPYTGTTSFYVWTPDGLNVESIKTGGYEGPADPG